VYSTLYSALPADRNDGFKLHWLYVWHDSLITKSAELTTCGVWATAVQTMVDGVTATGHEPHTLWPGHTQEVQGDNANRATYE